MFRHRWKILSGIALVFVLLTGIETLTIGNGPKKEVEAYKKSLIANGEKLQIAELVPPPVPPENNGADVVNEAIGMWAPEAGWISNTIPAMAMIGPGKAIVGFEQPDVRRRYFTNSWENDMAAVADDQPMDELLRQAMTYPTIDFRLNYDDWLGAGRYERGLFSLTGRLSVEAMCDLHKGDAASAGTNISAILALVKGVDNERFENIQNARVRATWLAAGTTWELLQSSNVTDAELSKLQGSWEGPEYIRAMENAVSMQRAFYESKILELRASKTNLDELIQGFEEDVDWSAGWRDDIDVLKNNAQLVCAKSMYRASWTYSDEWGMLKEHEIILQTFRTFETNQFVYPAYRKMTNELSAVEAGGPEDWLSRWSDCYLRQMYSAKDLREDAVSWTIEAEATRRLAIAAIALKRYQINHGDYPSSLSDLVPEFVSSVPQDPIDGKPLRYRRITDATFLLYSNGINGKDDGGDGTVTGRIGFDMSPRITDPGALDWVWPQPANAAEVEAFYAHPAWR